MPGSILLITTLHLDTTARLSMALSDAGCRVSVLCPPGHWVQHIERIDRRLHYSPIRPERALEAAIKAVQADLIIPCDDRAVRDMHALLARANGAVKACLERSLGLPHKLQ